jgi:hypothetical protein
MAELQNRAALLVPSYRKTQQVLANLSYLAALSSEKMHVWISDCSGDRGKQDYLKRLKKEHPFVRLLLREGRVPLYPDVAAAMNEMRSYAYVSICADDDYVSLPYLEGSIELLENDASCVCAFGNYIGWLNGVLGQDIWETTDGSPADRLQRAFNPGAFNRLFFAVFRRSAMQPWINFCDGHPLVGAFFDAIHFCSLVVQGPVRQHTNGFYFWTGENWDTQEKNYETKSRYYRDAGLPGEFAAFNDLHFGMEGISFFVGEHSPISDLNMRLACAQAIWAGCMSTFRDGVNAHEDFYFPLLVASPKAVESLRFLLEMENCAVRQALVAFEAILAVFSAPLAEQYGRHFRASLSRTRVTRT